ncbi:MAG: hypothetical protein PHD01_13365 [Geobacteraceae bacterium]|nr:hypothetical protein [Geobacteraceae bacterium]
MKVPTLHGTALLEFPDEDYEVDFNLDEVLVSNDGIFVRYIIAK